MWPEQTEHPYRDVFRVVPLPAHSQAGTMFRFVPLCSSSCGDLPDVRAGDADESASCEVIQTTGEGNAARAFGTLGILVSFAVHASMLVANVAECDGADVYRDTCIGERRAVLAVRSGRAADRLKDERRSWRQRDPFAALRCWRTRGVNVLDDAGRNGITVGVGAERDDWQTEGVTLPGLAVARPFNGGDVLACVLGLDADIDVGSSEQGG